MIQPGAWNWTTSDNWRAHITESIAAIEPEVFRSKFLHGSSTIDLPRNRGDNARPVTLDSVGGQHRQ